MIKIQSLCLFFMLSMISQPGLAKMWMWQDLDKVTMGTVIRFTPDLGLSARSLLFYHLFFADIPAEQISVDRESSSTRLRGTFYFDVSKLEELQIFMIKKIIATDLRYDFSEAKIFFHQNGLTEIPPDDLISGSFPPPLINTIVPKPLNLSPLSQKICQQILAFKAKNKPEPK